MPRKQGLANSAGFFVLFLSRYFFSVQPGSNFLLLLLLIFSLLSYFLCLSIFFFFVRFLACSKHKHKKCLFNTFKFQGSFDFFLRAKIKNLEYILTSSARRHGPEKNTEAFTSWTVDLEVAISFENLFLMKRNEL